MTQNRTQETVQNDTDPAHDYVYPFTENEEPIISICLAVAEVKDCDPLEIPPISDTISARALNNIIEDSMDVMNLTGTFEYAGCSITVTPEAVYVTDLE